MPRTRRNTLSRSPLQRLQLWENKVEGDTYVRQLSRVKELAIPKVAAYQYEQEWLIRTVKQVIVEYPSEAILQHEYLSFAEKLWKLSRTYGGLALRREADALFTWYMLRGRNEAVLRRIAELQNIIISSMASIIDRLAALGLEERLARLEEFMEQKRNLVEDTSLFIIYPAEIEYDWTVWVRFGACTTDQDGVLTINGTLRIG